MAQFFNTGFIILLVNANLTEHEPVEFTKLIKGPFYDYMPQWYIDVGMKIVLTMTINMIMPIISCAISFILPQVKVWYDSKGTFSPYVTRSKSMG